MEVVINDGFRSSFSVYTDLRISLEAIPKVCNKSVTNPTFTWTVSPSVTPLNLLCFVITLMGNLTLPRYIINTVTRYSGFDKKDS